MPLTNSEIAIIQHCLMTRIDKLIDYYVNITHQENGYEKVSKVVQESYSDLIPPSLGSYTKSSDNMYPTSKVMMIIKYELYGIFHPDLNVLNMLNVFSLLRNTRTEQITQIEFEKCKDQIKEQATRFISSIFKQHSKLPVLTLNSENSPINDHHVLKEETILS